MVTKTKKIKPNKMNSEAIIDKARQVVSALEKNMTIYESDLKRNAETLCNSFGVNTVEEALEKVEEMNQKLPGLQSERDQVVVEIQEYLTRNNL
jgi:hypothetical protein